MDTKLTLKLNKEIIEKAKNYAAQNKTSLSKIIENYLNSFINQQESNLSIELSTFVKSLKSGIKIPVDLDCKKEYSDNLLNKHK